MSDGYILPAGRVISPAKLNIPKAREMARALERGQLRWVELVECRRVELDGKSTDAPSESAETIVLDVEVEVPQRKAYDIRRKERLSVTFWPEDNSYPEVLALREGFPKIPHLNFNPYEVPPSLCLFDEPYSEIRLRWTAPWFVEWIRTWLASTAAGTLHTRDQALEPLLFGSQTILILPSDLFSEGAERPERLSIHAVNSGNDRVTLLGERPGQDAADQGALKLIATIIHGEPQEHGVIRRQPRNLSELHEFLEAAGVDLLGTLRRRLDEWRSDQDVLNRSLIIIATLPKTRASASAVESTDIWAFLCMRSTSQSGNRTESHLTGRDINQFLSVGEIGERIDLWQFHNGVPGLLIGAGTPRKGEDVSVYLLNPTLYLSRGAAARFNGLPARDARRVTAVGMGALGSQVFLNLVRAAFGEWVAIDKDFLLAHNLARHALFGMMTGSPKSVQMAGLANSVIDGKPIAEAIVADVLNPREAASRVSLALGGAEVIADFSASVAVARYLARDVKSDARRVSLFLNPRGTDIIMLGEDSERRIPLDALEMQYYRFLTNEPALHEHLKRPESTIRYAHSCRDLSSSIPQDLVALHAATGSRAMRHALTAGEATIAIWHAEEDGSVRRFGFDPAPIVERSFGNWTVCADMYLLEKVRNARMERLPNETGGSLIGSFDTQRRIVYVVDALPSPPDSEEHHTGYVRGHQGLGEGVERVKIITDGNLRYVGEWHSHPPPYDTTPSNDDHDLFQWLSDLMAGDGLPPLMLIVAGNDEYAWFLETMP